MQSKRTTSSDVMPARQKMSSWQQPSFFFFSSRNKSPGDFVPKATVVPKEGNQLLYQTMMGSQSNRRIGVPFYDGRRWRATTVQEETKKNKKKLGLAKSCPV